MKYLTIDNKILDEIDTSNYSSINYGCYNDQTEVLTICGQEDERVKGKYPQNPIVTNFHLSSGERNIIFKSLIYDCLWNTTENILIYSTGNTIYKYNVKTKENIKLHKFTSTRYSPINPSLSPNNKSLAYLKFKSNQRRIQILNLETGFNIDTGTNCNYYHWLSNHKIIFSTNSGKIKTLSIPELTTKETCINQNLIFKQKDIKSREIQESINQLNEREKQWTHFANPTIYNSRIYFLLKSGAANIYSLNSVNMEFEDCRVEYISNDVIGRYWLVENDLYLSMSKVIDNKWTQYFEFLPNEKLSDCSEFRIITNSYYSGSQISKVITRSKYSKHRHLLY